MKKVLILTAGFGEGHNTAAKNLKQGFDRVGDNETKVIDVFEISDPKTMAFSKKWYLKVIQSFPLVWRIIFSLTHYTNWVKNNALFFLKCRKTLEEIFEKEQPDIVCSTYPVYPNLFPHLRNTDKYKPFKKITVVTDSITIHSSWFTSESDYFIVPNEDTKKVFQMEGISGEKILPLGFPVQTFFADYQPQEIPPPEIEPRILYMINGHKLVSGQILADLLRHPKWKITVLVGKDEKLLNKLKPLVANEPYRAELIGWTKEVPRFLMEHHIIICKAGGAVVQESIAAQCPMVINHIVPGQEMGNYILLSKNNCCALANKTTEIAPLIEKALSDNARQWKEWKENLKKFNTKDSSLKIADFLLKL